MNRTSPFVSTMPGRIMIFPRETEEIDLDWSILAVLYFMPEIRRHFCELESAQSQAFSNLDGIFFFSGRSILRVTGKNSCDTKYIPGRIKIFP